MRGLNRLKSLSTRGVSSVAWAPRLSGEVVPDVGQNVLLSGSMGANYSNGKSDTRHVFATVLNRGLEWGVPFVPSEEAAASVSAAPRFSGEGH